MKVNNDRLAALFDITAHDVRVRGRTLSVFEGAVGGHACFIDVTSFLVGDDDAELELGRTTYAVKKLPNVGWWLDCIEHKGSDGKFHPVTVPSNELRQLIMDVAFADPDVVEIMDELDELIEEEQRKIAAAKERSSSRSTGRRSTRTRSRARDNDQSEEETSSRTTRRARGENPYRRSA